MHRFIIPVAFVLWAGCNVQLNMPREAVVVCQSDGDCPSGYRCVDELGRCLPEGISDAAPTIDGELSVSQTPARHGLDVIIQFTSTIELAERPRVRIVWPAAQRQAVFASFEASAYTYSFTPDEALDPEGPAAIDVEMVSVHGIVNTAHFPDALRTDFTLPALVPTTVSRRLEPDATNPLRNDPTRAVTAATDGTTVTVFFAVDESLASEPVVRSAKQNDTLFSLVPPVVGTFYTFALQVDAAVTEGSHPIEIVATDLAGNTATITLADQEAELPVVVDRTAPPPPDSETLGRLVYTRAPWGSEAAPEPTFTLTGLAGAVSSNATVLVYDGTEVATAAELGRVSADDRGAFGGPLGSTSSFTLNRADRREVFAVAVDQAGNQSDADPSTRGVQATLVSEVRWVATMGRKTAGSSWENPHRFEARPILASYLGQSSEPGVYEVGAEEVGLPDTTAVTTAGKGMWSFFDGTTWPRAGDVNIMATDTARGRLVVLGMADDGARTWEFDGSRWEQVADEGPSLRFGHAMAFDAGRNRMVLFGGGQEGGCGYDSLMFCGDTWEFDGQVWRRVAQGGPEPRGMHAMAYDPVGRQVILFGGLDVSMDNGGDPVIHNFTETWAWNGDTWNRLATSGPPGRNGHIMVTNATTGSVVMAAGYGSFLDPTIDCDEPTHPECTNTWEWNGGEWEVLTTSSPSGRLFPAAGYDPQRQAVVMHGGRYALESGSCASGSTELDGDCYFSDTWELRDGTWTRVNTTGPGPRWQGSLGYDSTGERAVLLGGESPSGTGCSTSSGDSCNDMWKWDGTAWVEVLRDAPAARQDFAMAHHEGAGVTVLFGGVGANCSALSTCGDTWIRDLAGWRQVASRPDARFRHCMTYDSVREELVMFGGRTNGGACDDASTSACESTWIWDATGWQESTVAAPAPRQYADMVFDRARKEVILFGGQHSMDCGEGSGQFCGWTWAWNGSGWRRLCARSPCSDTVPAPRYNHAMAYDQEREVVVLFGGTCTTGGDDYCLPETWEWNGTEWQQRCTSSPCTDHVPVRRSRHAMAFDPSRKRVVLLGGDYGEAGGCQEGAGWPCTFTWEWDGNWWHTIAEQGPFMDREDYALAADTSRHTVTTMVGKTDFATWDWHGGAQEVPGHVMFVDFAASGEDADLITPLSVQVRWDGGGTGFDSTANAQDGANLQLWQRGSWVTVQSDASAGGALRRKLNWSTTNDDTWSTLSDNERVAKIRNLFVGLSQTLHAALTPMTPNGPGGTQEPYAVVSTDYVEVAIDYRK